MHDSYQLNEQINKFHDDWNLSNIEILGRTNTVKIVLEGVDDDNSSATGKTSFIICSGLVSFSYSPDLLETLPSLLYKTTLGEIREEVELKEHEGFWAKGKSAHGPFLPFYRLIMWGWEFRLEVVCRAIQVHEETR